MESVFHQEYKQARKRGSKSSMVLWHRTLAGFLRSAPMEHLDVFRRDIRLGIRSLAKKPGFAMVSIAALAIGIGANIAVFSLANSLLLKPLPVAEPQRVIRVYANRSANVAYGDYLQYRDRNHTILELAAFQGAGISFRDGAAAEPALAVAVSGNYFTALGVPAALGRTIGTIDDEAGAPGAVMLSDAFWRRRFGADRGIIGRAVSINGRLFTI